MQRKIPKPIKEQFTHCFTGKSTGLSDILNINGYYENVIIQHWESGYGSVFSEGDSTFSHIIFYDDGSCYDAQEVSLTKEKANRRMSTLGKDKDSLWFYESDFWGIYKLFKDTIVVQRIRRAHSANDHWSAYEEKYLVVDRTTIQPLDYRRFLFERRPSLAYSGGKIHPQRKFIQLAHMPPPDSWMKKMTWFHCKPDDVSPMTR